MSSKDFDKKIQSLSDELATLGLTAKESRVYLALLRLGLVGSGKIISATQLHGQFVYQALAGLEAKGLVQHVIQRGRKKFLAQHPKTILGLLDVQRRTAESVIQELQSTLILPQPLDFEVHRGLDAYRSDEMKILETAAEGDSVLVIGGQGDRFIESMGETFGRYETLRHKKRIRVRYIGSEEQRSELAERSHIHRALFEYRLLPGLFTGLVNTDIWPQYLAFNFFGEPVTRFVIRQPEIAASYRGFFESLWKLGKT